MSTATPVEPAEETPRTAPKAKENKANPDGYLPLPPVKGRPKRGGGTTCTPQDMFEYWFRLPEKDRSRLIMYVYRDWPVVNPLQVLPLDQQERIRINKGRGGPEKNIAKWSEPYSDGFSREKAATAADWQVEVLNHFGCGKYHFCLNDFAGRAAEGSGGGNKQLALTYTEKLGDLDTYPSVLDYQHVVTTESDNNSFIQWCKLKGIKLFGDPDTPFDYEESEDMAASAEINRELTSTVNRLVDRITQEKPAPPPAPPSREDPDATAAAVSGVISTMSQMAKTQVDSITKVYERIAEAKDRQQDPMEHTRQVVELAKTLMPNAPATQTGPDPVVAAMLEQMKMLQSQMADMQRSQVRHLEERLAAAEARSANPAQAVAAVAPTGEASFMQFLKQLSTVKDTLSDLGIFGGAAEEAPESKWETLLKVGAPAVTKIFGDLASTAYNVAQMRTGQGNPMPPADPGQPAAVAQGPATLDSLKQFLPFAAEPIKAAVLSGQDGAAFAAEMLSRFGSQGAEIYNQIAQMGIEQFYTQIATHSPALGMFGSEQPEKFSAFLQQFMDSERVSQIYGQMQRQAAQPAPRVVQRPKPPGAQPQ